MKQTNIQFILIIILASTSCTTSKIIKSNVKPEEISNLQIFEPISYIYYIEHGNRAFFNDSLSKISSQLILKVSNDFFNQIKLNDEITFLDTCSKNKIKNEIELLVKTVNRYGNLYYFKLPPVMDSLLEINGKRFGLYMANVGFTRKAGNYYKQYAKGSTIGLLTLGLYYETPILCNSILYVIIADAKENNVALFRKSDTGYEPLNEVGLTNQFTDIFKGYFLKRK
jgi:hypothetical protein